LSGEIDRKEKQMSSVMEFQGVVAGERKKKASLAEDLRMAGVPILPKAEVKQFKREKVLANREGIWRWLWAIPVFFRHSFIPAVIAALAGMFFAGDWLIYAGYTWVRYGRVTVNYRWSLGVLAFSLALFGAYTALAAFLDGRLGSSFERAASFWSRTQAGKYNGYPSIPSAFSARTQTAQLAGSKVVVEALEEDPFLVAERGPWWNREREYIGAWRTGRDDFDNM
jgi:hypothetical protein